MLRPALLLPPQGLLTPRFDGTPLDARRWPATRRSGAYLGGTCTRWLGPAFRTRHGGKCTAPASRCTCMTGGCDIYAKRTSALAPRNAATSPAAAEIRGRRAGESRLKGLI